jgi:hypothetical protein
MATNFSDSQLSNYAIKYEQELCSKHDLIVDRVAIATTAGRSEYELPNYVTNIRMVLYLGKVVYAKGIRASVMTGDTPATTATNAPYEYLFNGKGMHVIKFFPAPDTSVTDPGGPYFDVTKDKIAVIVEFLRTPSQTDATLRLPSWMRRWLLKDYICEKCFSMEGPTQDLRGATYYHEKVLSHDALIGEIKSNLNRYQINVLSDRPRNTIRKPGHPVLPPNFGYPANY